MSLTVSLLGRFADAVDCCPWGAAAGRSAHAAPRMAGQPLYTPEQRRRRDASRWTIVQGVLAPLQFGIFLLSLGFVLHTLVTGNGADAAAASVVVKTIALLTIMVTGAMWERDVFGRYLFAPAFFWEDVFSFLVIALHLAYVAALIGGTLDVRRQLLIALAAYVAYVINATQFVLKLRAARREQNDWTGHGRVSA